MVGVFSRVRLMRVPDEVEVVARDDELGPVLLLQLEIPFVPDHGFLQKFRLTVMRKRHLRQ